MSEENDNIFQSLSKHDYGLSFGHDPRFVNTHDQQRWCWTLFNDFLRCKHKLGEDAPRCVYLNTKAHSICPNSTIDKYNEFIEEGRWWGYRPPSEKKDNHGHH